MAMMIMIIVMNHHTKQNVVDEHSFEVDIVTSCSRENISPE